ncbi:hypothetical protein Scep_000710 [Stephania cephalantha]|uniref:Methyltransferase type 11 domain-containing protein n=1 Tax=Stephania cephalantha TaxID=152367 RepID=A0AAP0Q4D6_9MAGN
MMELRLLKLQLIYHNYSPKILLVKIFILATAMASIPCFNFVYTVDQRDNLYTVQASNLRMNATEIQSAIEELLKGGEWLNYGDRALALGRNSAKTVMVMRKLGFPDAIGVDKKPCSLVKRGDIYALPFKRRSFDFVLSTAFIDGVSIPAKMVIEMERVLKPGGHGVVLRRMYGHFPVMKAAAPVASYLKGSDIVGVRAVNCTIMVIFRKRVFRDFNVEKVSDAAQIVYN